MHCTGITVKGNTIKNNINNKINLCCVFLIIFMGLITLSCIMYTIRKTLNLNVFFYCIHLHF